MEASDKLLQQKIQQSVMVIEDMLDTFPTDKILIAWSGGKDSTLLLKILLDVCQQRQIPVPRALDIDQGDAFAEINEFRERIVELWGFDMMVVRNDDFFRHLNKFGDKVMVNQLNEINRNALAQIGYAEDDINWQPESPVCNHLLKTVPINQTITEMGIEALLTGIRWDEHGARNNETYFSQRQNPKHTRVHPLLHLKERDIWDTHFMLDIPFNDLYRQGYRSLDTKHGTKKHSELPAWEQDLENTNERGSRSAEKEKVMEQLRRWGYM